MTPYCSTLAFALLLLLSGSAAAQTPSAQDQQAASKDQLVERAKARCTLNRGVDCETAEGLKEWLLAERSREEAVLDGSRRRLPAQNKPAPPRR